MEQMSWVVVIVVVLLALGFAIMWVVKPNQTPAARSMTSSK